MDRQRETNWPQQLEQLVPQAHPLFSEICTDYPMTYYWTCAQSEWAADYVFADASQLRRLYPQLLQLGMTSFSSPDVLRFMGKKVSRQGTPLGGYELPISTDLKVRTQGVRIKHRLGPNSIKLYDKAYDELGAVLRPEITLNVPKYFRVFRSTDAPHSKPAWRPLRRGTVDMDRRAEVSQKVLDRYCSALAAVDAQTPLGKVADAVSTAVTRDGRRARGINPLTGEDARVASILLQGEFSISGFRNGDVRTLLYPEAQTADDRRRASGKVTRLLRLFRAHGLIQKIPGTHRYKLTAQGRRTLPAFIVARNASTEKLNQLAA
jgi:hypothetical protein